METMTKTSLSKVIICKRKMPPEGHYFYLFGRADDGKIIGSVNQEEAKFTGDDPATGKCEYFINEEFAIAWVKRQVRGYLGREDVDFEMRIGEPRIDMSAQRSGKLTM